jgi:phosphoglycerate dehydrogenase-like enzyme
MARTNAGDAPLRTVVIAMSVPEDVLAQFRATFPEIDFIVTEEEESTGAFRYTEISEEGWPAELQIADAIIAWEVPSAMLAAAPRLSWIHSGGAGVSHFDLDAIAARGIVLTNASGVSAPNMAEHVMGMMIALARRLPRLVLAQSRREWRDDDTHAEVVELQGQTMLVVGVGDIGSAVGVRASAFGMRVHGVRRRVTEAPPGFDAMFDQSSLLGALADADHVVVTLPDTPRTRRLFDATAFAAMKRGAMIYNVGRGTTIDTTALIDALRSGHLGGAGLDVTDPEPLPADSPLWDMENVLITAHTSGATPRYWERQSALITENLRRLQQGARPLNVVDLDAGY